MTRLSPGPIDLLSYTKLCSRSGCCVAPGISQQTQGHQFLPGGSSRLAVSSRCSSCPAAGAGTFLCEGEATQDLVLGRTPPRLRGRSHNPCRG